MVKMNITVKGAKFQKEYSAYCKLSTSDPKKVIGKTKSASAKSNPDWDQVFEVETTEASRNLTFECYDKHLLLSDKLIGHCIINITKEGLLAKDGWMELKDEKNLASGEIHISIHVASAQMRPVLIRAPRPSLTWDREDFGLHYIVLISEFIIRLSPKEVMLLSLLDKRSHHAVVPLINKKFSFRWKRQKHEVYQPTTFTALQARDDANQLPKHIEKLTIEFQNPSRLTTRPPSSPSSTPVLPEPDGPVLTNLSGFKQLCELDIVWPYKVVVNKGDLPASLQKLRIKLGVDQALAGIFPQNLVDLTIIHTTGKLEAPPTRHYLSETGRYEESSTPPRAPTNAFTNSLDPLRDLIQLKKLSLEFVNFQQTLSTLPRSITSLALIGNFPVIPNDPFLSSFTNLTDLFVTNLYFVQIPLLPPNLLHLKMLKLTSGVPSIPPFPHTLTSLDVTECTNGTCEITTWPPNLQVLIDRQRFFPDAKILPPTLRTITFGPNFNNNVNKLPPNLTEVNFGFDFKMAVDSLLPPTLTKLTFGDWFDQPIDKLPPSLEILHLGSSFNRLLEHLPPALRELRLSGSFNQPIDSLPQHLLHLSFFNAFFFNQPISHLPNGLVSLRFGNRYVNNDGTLGIAPLYDLDQPLEHLPASLSYFFLASKKFNQPVKVPHHCLVDLCLPPVFEHESSLPPGITFQDTVTRDNITYKNYMGFTA